MSAQSERLLDSANLYVQEISALSASKFHRVRNHLIIMMRRILHVRKIEIVNTCVLKFLKENASLIAERRVAILVLFLLLICQII